MLFSSTRPPRRTRWPGWMLRSAAWLGVKKNVTVSCNAISASATAPPSSASPKLTKNRRLCLAFIATAGLRFQLRQFRLAPPRAFEARDREAAQDQDGEPQRRPNIGGIAAHIEELGKAVHALGQPIRALRQKHGAN